MIRYAQVKLNVNGMIYRKDIKMYYVVLPNGTVQFVKSKSEAATVAKDNK